jgi:hypothetical protein
MMSRTTGRGLVPALLTAALFASACEAPGDTETTDSNLVAPNAPPKQEDARFNFDLVSRGARTINTVRCKNVCTDSRQVGRDPDHERCVKWEQQCNYEPSFVSLYEDPDIDHSVELAPYSETPFIYRGCGQSAIQNVLHWYGVNMSLGAIYQQTDSWKAWPWTDGHNIATTPNAVVESLQNLLDKWASGRYRVESFSGPVLYFVAMANLRRGNPVIVMVNSGQHWQVITGYRQVAGAPDQYRVIDYPGNGGMWVSEPDLRRQLEGEFALWAETIGFGGFDHNKLITITRE